MCAPDLSGCPSLVTAEAMPIAIQAVISAVVILIGSLLTYKATTRVANGSISTTAAETLWVEVNRVKDEYQRQAVDAREQASKVKTELAGIQGVCASLRERVIEVEIHAQEAMAATAECHERERILVERVRALESA